MTTLRLRLPAAVSRALSQFVSQLCALEEPALSAAVDRVKATAEPRGLEMAVFNLIQDLGSRDAAKQMKAARVLELFGPVAAPQLVTMLYESKDTAFRVRLAGVLAAIGPAARDLSVPAFIGLLVNQPEQALLEAGWAGLLRLGPARGDAASGEDRPEA